MTTSLPKLNKKIISCKRCSRLLAFRSKIAVEKRKQYIDDEYWDIAQLALKANGNYPQAMERNFGEHLEININISGDDFKKLSTTFNELLN